MFYLIERDGELRITGNITEIYLDTYLAAGWSVVRQYQKGDVRRIGRDFLWQE